MKNKILLLLLGSVLWSCTTDTEDYPLQMKKDSKEIQQRSYSKDYLPFKKEEILHLVEMANQKNIEISKNDDRFSSFAVSNTLSLGEEVVENRREDKVTYSIGLHQAHPSEKEFKNLVIEKNDAGTKEVIYLITYYPSEAYIQLHKQGYIDTPFDGNYEVEVLRYFDEELLKKVENSSYTVCIPIRIHKRCTAGGNHTPRQENLCRAKGTDAGPKIIERMSCYTFFDRDRGGILSKPVEEKDKVSPISFGNFVGNTGGGSHTHNDNTPPPTNVIPKYECMNADCSEIRAIDPMEMTPVKEGENIPYFADIVVEAPDLPIADIKKYLGCFDTSKGATLTIYVDQPAPNENKPYKITLRRKIDVGHTFVSLTQGDNTAVYGFYPSKKSTPIIKEDVSTLADDSAHEFDVSISVEINAITLQKVLQKSINYPQTYNLDTYNCTDFGIEIGNEAGLNLSDAFNSWGVGRGSNPGTLGQELRKQFKDNKDVKLDTKGGKAPKNKKNC